MGSFNIRTCGEACRRDKRGDGISSRFRAKGPSSFFEASLTTGLHHAGLSTLNYSLVVKIDRVF